ncbi:MAG: phospholipid carrier-dependent glycosyltransferase [Candidatus Pacebacteria bacterium]|nr:phospholipid carrier-dependent glycosyltransferase [Candidatus Paceibacterota bacterium]
MRLSSLRFSFFSRSFLILAGILIFSLLIRVWRLDQPLTWYFDEAYHVPAVRLIAENDPRVFEWWHGPIYGQSNHDWLHPPLAKYLQAGSVKVLGNNSFAWRLPSAIFGTLLVFLTYCLAWKLFNKQSLALLAAWLVSLDGLVLVQSRLAMNDVFVSCFWLASLIAFYDWLQQKKPSKLVLTGLSVGLGLASKWTMVFGWVGIIGWLLIDHFFSSSPAASLQRKTRQLPLVIFSLVLFPAAVYFASYLPMFFQGKNLGNWIELHRQIWLYQANRDLNHAYSSQPWEWFFNLRPVWYWHEQRAGLNSNLTANIYALGNPVFHALGWLGLAGLSTSIFSLKNETKKKLFLVGSYFVIWLPWIFSPRIMFYYHYLPGVALLAIIAAWFLQTQVWPRSKLAVVGTGLLTLLAFLIFIPHWTGLAIPKLWAERIYFLLESWR